MPVRKRVDEVFPNAAGIDVGGSSHWVAVPPHFAEKSVTEFGAMTDDLSVMADRLLECGSSSNPRTENQFSLCESANYKIGYIVCRVVGCTQAQ